MFVDTSEDTHASRTLQVETLVPPPLRAVIESAVVALGERSSANQRPATSDQRPATSDQRPATSDQRPATAYPFATQIASRIAIGRLRICVSLCLDRARGVRDRTASGDFAGRGVARACLVVGCHAAAVRRCRERSGSSRTELQQAGAEDLMQRHPRSRSRCVDSLGASAGATHRDERDITAAAGGPHPRKNLATTSAAACDLAAGRANGAWGLG